MQFQRAFTFPFADEKWFRKILLPAALLPIPVIGILAVTGWALRISRRVIRSEADAVPGISLRRDTAAGAAGWGIGLAYAIPGLLWLALGTLFSAVVFPAGADVSDWFDLYWWCIELAALAIGLGGGLLAIAALGRYADTAVFRAAFQFRAIIQIVRAGLSGFVLVMAAWIPLGLLAGSGVLICCVGGLFTSAYAAAAGFHLAGPAYARAVAPRPAAAETPG